MRPAPSMFPPDVDSATLDAGWEGIRSRRIVARRKRRVLLATPVVAALLALFVVFGRRSSPVAQNTSAASGAPHVLALAGGNTLPPVWSAATPNTIAFDDGSHVELASATRLRTLGEQRDPAHVDLALDDGTATFDIRPGGPRAWMIEAGDTRVRVLGTRFTVARTANHVHVTVERGKVRVESARIAGGGRDLVAGQDVDVGGSPIEKASVKTDPPAAVKTSMPTPTTTTAIPVASSKLDAPPPDPAPPSAPAPRVLGDRMARADAARAAGNPREALVILESVVDDNAPSAPLAAFTMGKIHSESLGDAASAAVWFERAIRLGLPVGLDEDAHARVVECYGRAGRADEAARAAARYEATFPAGRHLARVKRWTKE